MESSPDRIPAAIGRIPSGCFILTAEHAGRSTGVLASWVQQTSFDPPLVTAALRPGRPIVELIEGSRGFVINVIGDPPTAMFKQFGKGFTLEQDAFVGVAIEQTSSGPRILSCPAYLVCRLRDRVSAGDHDLFVGEVIGGDGDPAVRPYVHLRGNGLSY